MRHYRLRPTKRCSALSHLHTGKPTFRLWPKTLEGRSSLLSPLHCLTETNLKEKDYPFNSEGQVVRFLPLLAQKQDALRSRIAPAFDVIQLVAHQLAFVDRLAERMPISINQRSPCIVRCVINIDTGFLRAHFVWARFKDAGDDAM